MSRPKGIISWLWVVSFIPASCLLAGVLAYATNLSAPGSGRYGLWDAFQGYSPFWPGTYGIRHIPSLTLGFAVLLLLAVSRRSPRPLVSWLHIRVILIVLFCLITLLVKILFVIAPLGTSQDDVVPLFIYVDLDLVLTFFLTYRFGRPAETWRRDS